MKILTIIAQAWHYTNARINELIQEVERILEAQGRQMSEESQFGPLEVH